LTKSYIKWLEASRSYVKRQTLGKNKLSTVRQ
jgi:hypothetical protein